MDSNTFTIRDAIQGIAQRKLLVAFIFFSVLALIGFATIFATKIYESEARVFVRLGRENVGLDPTSTLGEGTVVTTPISREAEINSVVHMIRNRDLYQKVVDKFGPEQIINGVSENELEGLEIESPGPSWMGQVSESLTEWGVLNDVPLRERALIKLEKKFTVKALDHSNVIMISYECESPLLAQEIVSFLVNSYVGLHQKLHRPSGALAFLKDQTSKIESGLADRENDLEKFKTESGMISSDLQKRSLVERISSVKSQLRDATVNALALDSEVNAIKTKLIDVSETHVVAKTVGAGNQGIDGMRQDLYRQELELASARGTLSDNHPKVQSLRKSVSESREILDRAEEHRTESILGVNPVFSEIQLELLKKEANLVAANARIQELKRELAKEQQSLVQFGKDEKTFSMLTRQLEIQDDNYRRYVRNLAQANLDNSLEKSKVSNISVSQSASYNEKPVRPNKLINLLAGLVLATSLSTGYAILLAYLSPTQNLQPNSQTTLPQAVTPEPNVASQT